MKVIQQPVLTLPALQKTLTKGTLCINAFGLLLVALFATACVLQYVMGALVGWVYLRSLFFAAQNARPKLGLALSTLRVVITAFLLVFIGRFKLFDTAIVMAGCLGYKLMLVVVSVRYSVGIPDKRGN